MNSLIVKKGLSMKRMKVFGLLILSFLVLTIIEAGAANRTPLVIGNGNYFSAPLTNPINDARDMARVLKKLGFDVALKTDVSKNVMVDACRDNPFKRSFRTSQKGFAQLDAPLGTVIAYATEPGDVSSDGVGRNGTYTEALMKNFQNFDLDVQKLFNRTGLDVMEKTDKKQVPWVSTTLFSDYYLAKGILPPSSSTPDVQDKANQESIVVRLSTPGVGDNWKDPVTGIEFVWVPGGCFQMGNNSGQSDEKPAHQVCVDGFWMGKYEVTQGHWQRIMGNNPSKFKSGNEFPVEQVSWQDAQDFKKKLNRQSGRQYALPSEAQWEYAARSGGKNQTYAGGNDIDRVAWYDGNSGNKTHPVGTKASNGLGIFDMSGNVWEWCEDVYDGNAYSKHSRNNPESTSGSSGRVFRGGSWDGVPRNCRATFRCRFRPSFRYSYGGFRLVLLLGQ